MLTTQEEVRVIRQATVLQEPGERLPPPGPRRRRFTPVLAAGAVLVGILNAGVFLILDGFAVKKGLVLALEVTLGIVAFVTALLLSELEHRRHAR